MARAEGDDGFHAAATDINRHLNAVDDANRARRAELLQHFGGGGGPAVAGHFHDVSPLLRGFGCNHYYADPINTAAAAGRNEWNGRPSILTSSEAVERHVRDAVAKALSDQEERVAALVTREWDRRSLEMEHNLRNRFTDLQVLHESTGRLLRDVAGTVASLKIELSSAVEKFEASVDSVGGELRARIADISRTTNREIVSLRETVLEIQSRFAVDTADYSRRIEASQRRAAEAHSEVLVAVEQRTAQMRADLETLMRESTRKLQSEIDAASRVVEENRAIAAHVDVDTRRFADKLAEMHEDAVIRRSELRTLREDVQQLELYVKGRIDKIAVAALRPSSLKDACGPRPAGIDTLQRDVYALQQGLAFVSSRLQSLGVLEDGEDGATQHEGSAQLPHDVSDTTAPRRRARPSAVGRSKRRYSQTSDPFAHSAGSFIKEQQQLTEEEAGGGHESDVSNRRLANSGID